MGPEGTKWERNLPPIVVSESSQTSTGYLLNM